MKRYIVYLANGESVECYRTWLDWWFDSISGDFVRFRLHKGGDVLDGKAIEWREGAVMMVSKHFTIRVVKLK